MSSQPTDQEPTQRELSEAANEKIRDAAKWLIASFAAVGAVLIAGSQLSSIGRLSVCPDLSLECTRLWWAIGGGVVGLGGVVWAIWIAVGLLIPPAKPPSALQADWERGNKSTVYNFFTNNPDYLQGFSDFRDIQQKESEAYARFDRVSTGYDKATGSRQARLGAQLEQIAAELRDLTKRSEAAVSLANQIDFAHTFRTRALGRILLAAAVASIGIGIFAWAANPPPRSSLSASLHGADLTGADLSGTSLRNTDLGEANLSGADLTGADLEGADLEDAVLDGVQWSGTICPDGRVSDQVGGTCINHLVAAGNDG